MSFTKRLSPATRKALYLTVLYMLLAAVWIVIFDFLLVAVVANRGLLHILQTTKGMGFVLLTGALFGFFMRQYLTDLNQKQRYTQILEQHTTDLFLFFNTDRQIVHATPACAGLTGYDPIELRTVDFIERVHHQDRELVRTCFAAAYAGESGSGTEFRIVTKDGSEKWVRSAWGPMHDAIERTAGIYMRLHDITETRAVQERMHLLHTSLMQSEKLATLGRLTADTAHELSSPMTSILGYTEMLLLSDLPAQVREDLTMIEAHAQRACRIVTNLLKFARQRAPERLSTQINDVVIHSLELRANRLRAQNVEVLLLLGADLPEVMVDPFQLQQVVLNLIINAEQALTDPIWRTHAFHSARLTVETAYHPPAPDEVNGTIIIRVRDNGPGIAPDIRERIFEPFFTTREQGTGLGLSISAEIIRDHGGQMLVRSRAGRGTTMEILLPATELAVRELSVASHDSIDPELGQQFLAVDQERHGGRRY